MLPAGHLTDLLATGFGGPGLAPLAQAGAEGGGISGVALWVGLLALLVIFLAIIMRAFGQRRVPEEKPDELPEPDEEAPEAREARDEDEAERKPSLKEIREARAKKVVAEASDKESLIKARQARKGATRAAIEEAEEEIVDETAEPSEPEFKPKEHLEPLGEPQPVAEADVEADEKPEPDKQAEALEKPRAEITEKRAPEEKPEAAEKPKPEVKAAPRVDEKPKPKPKPEPKPQKTLEEGLAKTRSGFFSRLKGLFTREKPIDDDLMGELEEVLLTADIGVKTSMKLLESVEQRVGSNGETDSAKVWKFLRDETSSILRSNQRRLVIGEERPYVILVIGVNGVGKTTTIGKLASRYKSEGHEVLLIAGDTFRAAAIDQIKIWGERAGVEVFAGAEGADPSGVVFDGVKRAIEANKDVVLIDTAGRLHTKVNLVEELKKVRRVCGKALEGSPHEVLLVLDANTGQNAINQADMFGKEVGVTGIALTKLDGTAKGGVVIGISDELGVPVQFIGIGEQVEDLREFDADEFVDAVF